MNNKEIMAAALAQSAIDANCRPDDFLAGQNVVVVSQANPGARKYLQLPFSCNLISYGTNIVASIEEPYREIVQDYLDSYAVEHCFETPNMHVLNDAMQKVGMRVCFMAEYFLPELELMELYDCAYELKVLHQEDFKNLYDGQWPNALCADRRQLDVLGVGAYDNGELIALAGCSADCDTMYQIGIDVKPAYRRQGIATALTTHLAKEILTAGKVPFYCAAWSNLKSVRNAINSGFRPAWVEMTVKPSAMVDGMNARKKNDE